MKCFFKRRRKVELTARTKQPRGIDYRAVAATDVGQIRENNEDRVLFTKPFDTQKRNAKGCLAIVADGMGGHENGEVASGMAAELISRNYYDRQDSPLKALKQAFEIANRSIYKASIHQPTNQRMGTTCTAVVLLNNQLVIGHVGDCRLYLISNDNCEQLTKDHTYVQQLVDAGAISPHEAETHPKRNIITKAMGTKAKVVPDFFKYSLEKKTSFKLLLCSDGLYEYLKDDELQELVQELPASEAANELIKRAKQRGGHDNISVLIVESAVQEQMNPSKLTKKIA